MPTEWYCRIGDVKSGPFRSAELKQMAQSGKLHPGDLIWRDGLDGWKQASKVKGLFDVADVPNSATQVQLTMDSVAWQSATQKSVSQDVATPDTMPVQATDKELVPRSEYKVLSQKDKWFSRKFDPDSLELALNSYSQQGWRVRAGDTASFPGFISSAHREEFIAIMERGQDETMYEYKILSQKDKWYSGKFDPELIEGALNAYASQGWRVVLATTASFPGLLSGHRDELIVILERRRGHVADGY
jgi:hypothetical protein